jgi:uncharacterized protein YbcI
MRATTTTASPIHDRNATAGGATADAAASPMAGNGQRRPPRGAGDGAAAMAICNAVTGALKQSCGKGPTKVKAYTLHDHVVVVVQDMLTTLEKTLVQSGHEQLVREARHALAAQVAKESRATIEQATGRRVIGWQTEVNPSPDRAFALVRLQPLGESVPGRCGPEAPAPRTSRSEVQGL